jgi:hypothetical protein
MEFFKIYPFILSKKFQRQLHKEQNVDTGNYTTQEESVSERTIPTERPPLVGEVSFNFCS